MMRTSPRTILVVEADPTALHALRRALDHGGHQTIAATTAEAATRMLRGNGIYALLFELGVVHADPAAWLRAWRAARPGTPIILCAVWDPDRLTTLFGEDPPDGFLPRPFTAERLHAELGRAVRLHRPASGISAWHRAHVPALARPASALGSPRSESASSRLRLQRASSAR
jgi:DNA-binding response OmpR family regulator